MTPETQTVRLSDRQLLGVMAGAVTPAVLLGVGLPATANAADLRLDVRSSALPNIEQDGTPSSANWPKTAQEAASKFGGTADQWMRNSEWPDTRTINNEELGITGYVNREWRPKSAENMPFPWPKTAQEAVNYFFPGQNIDAKFIQPAWTDPATGIVTGWHLSEDHWLFGSNAQRGNVKLTLHPAEVAEGYTVNGNENPVDDRHFLVYGGYKQPETGDDLVQIEQKNVSMKPGQGFTIWMPGTDPNAIALRMENFEGADTPCYRGPSGEQLGANAYGFTPVYKAANLVNAAVCKATQG